MAVGAGKGLGPSAAVKDGGLGVCGKAVVPGAIGERVEELKAGGRGQRTAVSGRIGVGSWGIAECLVPGAWCLVLGAWCLVLSA